MAASRPESLIVEFCGSRILLPGLSRYFPPTFFRRRMVTFVWISLTQGRCIKGGYILSSADNAVRRTTLQNRLGSQSDLRFGTFATCRQTQKLSVKTERPEVGGTMSE
jgi:hypothetical protein